MSFVETGGYSEGSDYPMAYLKLVPLVKKKLQRDFNVICSVLPAEWMCSGPVCSTRSLEIDKRTCSPMASQWLGYTQDAAEGFGLRCVSVEGERKHSGGGKDQREPNRGVQTLLQ